MTDTNQAIMWVYSDGGRSAAGYRGIAKGDCAARAAAIASGRPYGEVYALINEYARKERRGVRKKGISHASSGVYRSTMRKVMRELGAEWVPTMTIGSGTQVHVRMHELPPGRLVLSLSKHYSAVIDRVIFDTHDPSREGSRCVYGYWIFEEPPLEDDE